MVETKQRYCDHIDGMDYLVTCPVCTGDGEYEQTYTIGCGQGYFQSMGPCDYCAGTGVRVRGGGTITSSQLAQITTRMKGSDNGKL